MKLSKLSANIACNISILIFALTSSVTLATEQTNNNEVHEIIQIKGDYPLGHYRNQFKEADIGSRIKKQYCYPQYFLNKMAEITQNSVSSHVLGVISLPSHKQVESLTRTDRENALIHAEKIINSHPELVNKVLNLQNKRELYEAKLANL